jgi:hypothetical protein
MPVAKGISCFEEPQRKMSTSHAMPTMEFEVIYLRDRGIKNRKFYGEQVLPISA